MSNETYGDLEKLHSDNKRRADAKLIIPGSALSIDQKLSVLNITIDKCLLVLSSNTMTETRETAEKLLTSSLASLGKLSQLAAE